jgi:hypothetical protein
MITKLNDFVSIIDTVALGQPKFVAAYLVSGKEKPLVGMGFESSASNVIEHQSVEGLEDKD